MLKSEKKISDDKYTHGTEIERSSKKFLIDMASECEKGHALDIGCGTGVNANHLKKLGFKITGLDLSHLAIKKLIDNGHEGIVHDIANGIPFKENSFELVFASEVIEHLDDIVDFLTEIKRVLKPGGTLLLSTQTQFFGPIEYLH